MNLLTSDWIPVFRQNGAEEIVSPAAIGELDNPILEINAPRADFQGALYQLLIGLLQTTFAPEDQSSWRARYQTPPSPDELTKAFQPFREAFELSASGPAFLQDFNLPAGETKPISALLIDSPGAKTVKDNLDLFIKRDDSMQLCSACAATALFTLQTNAPAGGAGHRVGLRGGGPLTTLIQPRSPESSLWQKLWLNVLNSEELDTPAQALDPNVFPWLAETRRSDKTGGITTPNDVYRLQAYWGMPRRIRLEKNEVSGTCSICRADVDEVFRTFRMQNYGVNYDGPWLHPLTPYRHDPKQKELPLSLKGQPGGFSYRHWLGLVFADGDNGDKAAEIVTAHVQRQRFLPGEQGHARLWCFGYDLDNMKARCWYDSTMPLFALSPQHWKKISTFISRDMLKPASDAVSLLRKYLKQAWLGTGGDKSADFTFIDKDFWPSTEPIFYEVVQSLMENVEEEEIWTSDQAKRWHGALASYVMATFDRWALSGPPEDLDMKRVIDARQALQKLFLGSKAMKALRERFVVQAAMTNDAGAEESSDGR